MLASAKAVSIENFAPPTTPLAGFAQVLTIKVGPHPDTTPTSQATSTIAVLNTDNVASLAGKINNVTGLKAEVVNTGDGTATPYKILITGDVGENGNFSILSDNAGKMVSDYTHAVVAGNSLLGSAGNATLNMDGIAVERPSNTIDDLVGGVTLKLLAADTLPYAAVPVPTTITSTLSSASVESSVKSLMAELNLYKADMDALGFVDEVGGADGELAQNSYLRSAQRQFQKLISTPILGYNGDGILRGNPPSPNRPIHFVDLGIKTSRDGSLVFDQSTFNRTFAKEPWKFDALTRDVAYSSDPNVQVIATPTSEMPAGGHAFANHQRLSPSSSVSNFTGFRSLTDKMSVGSRINYSDSEGNSGHIDVAINDTIRTIVNKLNNGMQSTGGVNNLTASITGPVNGIYGIRLGIPQNTVDTLNQPDTGDVLTMGGSLNNTINGVSMVHAYGGFVDASTPIPAETYFIRTPDNVLRSVTTLAGQTVTNLTDSLNNLPGISAHFSGRTLELTANTTGFPGITNLPTIKVDAFSNANSIPIRAPVDFAANTIGNVQNNQPAAQDEVWQDVVNVIPNTGNFTKVDTNGSNSAVGSGAGTYSSPDFKGFQFTTSNDQAAMYLYVGRSVRTLVNNFFTNALKSNATHQTVSQLYSDTSKGLTERLAQIDAREEILRSRYTTQFAAMEGIVTTGSSTSEFLDNMVAGWNKS